MRSSQYTAPYSITWQCAAFLLGEITSDTSLLKDSRSEDYSLRSNTITNKLDVPGLSRTALFASI
jgi:hypothetical protein